MSLPSDGEIRALVEALDRERQAWIEGRIDPTASGLWSQARDIGPEFAKRAVRSGPDQDARTEGR